MREFFVSAFGAILSRGGADRTMTTLLAKAMERIESLSEEIQDEIAEQLLDDLENELRWQETLAKPQPKLRKLAEKALRESRTGKTSKMGFDEL
jgi:predicted house-cleaning noncanonical NTP pyrophosphatase (MazG superfamily)